ncbi:MAG TPA: DUF4013 domain-containing protein [Anaerolineales bacterium]|nr:DUF4013 domain-containing protein [Anaerolineales bacterium]
MDIGKSFSFPFEDEKWLSKLLIGAIVAAIPIVNFAFTGYAVDTLKSVMAGMARPLPDWVDWGEKFMKGLILALAGLVYSIPVICVSILALTPLLAISGGQNTQEMQEGLAWLTSGLGLAVLCFVVLYGLALSFFLPAMAINFARKGTFGSCFEIGGIVRIFSANMGKYLTAWLVTLLAGILVSVVVSVVFVVLNFIPCLGQILALFVSGVAAVYPTLVGVHLFGQVAGGEAMTSMEPAA